MNDMIEDFTTPHRSLDRLRLGEIQHHRLLQIVRRHREAIFWDGRSEISDPGVAVIVLNEANSVRTETFARSLHGSSVVIIPHSENPAFDLLKSKLHSYGSIGSQGAEAPHHVWWGGVKPLAIPTGLYQKDHTLFISLFERSAFFERRAQRLAFDLKRSKLRSAIAGINSKTHLGLTKVDYIVRQWEQTDCPIFWIAPNATIRSRPLLPQSIGCDFAVYKSRSGRMETGAMFFHRTEPARALLDLWQRLSHLYPDVPESFLLDQAWTSISSQRQLDTLWLPDCYWRSTATARERPSAVIEYDDLGGPTVTDPPIALHFQRARRFDRHQAPEPHLIMQSASKTGEPITVLIRDVLTSKSTSVSTAVEAAALAFANDPGGFSRMELVLGAWSDDVDAVIEIADDGWVLLIDPDDRLQPDTFRKLAALNAGGSQALHSGGAVPGIASISELAGRALHSNLEGRGGSTRVFLKRKCHVSG